MKNIFVKNFYKFTTKNFDKIIFTKSNLMVILLVHEIIFVILLFILI